MTIEVPETVYQKLSVLPENGRNQYIALSLERGMTLVPPEEFAEYEETVSVLNEAFAEVDAGKTRPFADFARDQQAFWREQGL
ncbi:MAG: hypothetical protein H7145_20185 [Akkermansiaceae bacterium]|nr:hypothetical protein [Armatimonadota bacterium]